MNEEGKTYKLLEHVGDSYIVVYGNTLKKAFENAAVAMFDIMTDVNNIEPIRKDEFTVEAKDEVELLHEWLEKLLLAFEIRNVLYSKFQIKDIIKKKEKIILKAEAYGENFNPLKHLSKVEVKAVTYHKMTVEKRGDIVKVKFILDL